MSEQALKQQIQNLKKHNARLARLARDARNKLSAALDGTGLCLWQLDIPSGKLIIYNRRWGSMLGYQPKELNAQFEVWREHLHPEDRQMVLDAFYDHLHGKTPFYEALHRMQHKNGTVSWVLDRGRVSEWDEHGNPLRVTGTHIDMTKEKQYEEQLALLANHDPLTGWQTVTRSSNILLSSKIRGRFALLLLILMISNPLTIPLVTVAAMSC